MEQTPLPPLVSDEYLSSLTPISEDWKDGPCSPVTPTEVRNIYEADRIKAREVVQALVDACYKLELQTTRQHALAHGYNPARERCLTARRIAKSVLNIEPTKP